MEEIDTDNQFMVGSQGTNIIVLRPPSVMTKEQAVRFAAWLVTLADDNNQFDTVLEAVQNT